MAEQAAHWRGRRVFVTGCTGLIGRAAIGELLARGATVVGLVRDRGADAEVRRDALFRQVQFVRGCVEDRFRVQSALSVHAIETVFHLAGPTDGADPDRGTASVLTAARDLDRGLPVVAARPLPPLGLARATAGDRAFRPVPWGVAQFGEVFGGGDRKTFRVVPAAILARLTGDRGPAAAEPGPARDFVHAPDAGRACLALAEALAAAPPPHPLAVPFRTGWAFDDRGMAAAVRAVLADEPSPSLSPAPPADRPLGWAPEKSLPDALRETAGWYREFLKTWFFGTRAAEPKDRAAA